MRRVIDEAYLDLWVIEHFRVLPTDSRFLDLSERQKYLLFQSFMELPSSEELKANYRASKHVAQIDDDTAENLKNIGYTAEQIKRMQAQLQLAGVS